MEREIKFRAWNEEAKRYSKPFGLNSNVLNFTDDDGLGVVKSITNEVIEQFTGLKDKNGVEIYEGDNIIANGWKLVKTNDYSNARRYVSSTIRDTYDSIYGRYEFICYWNDCFSQFGFKEINKNEEIASDVSDRDYEIIGNIHTK